MRVNENILLTLPHEKNLTPFNYYGYKKNPIGNASQSLADKQI